MKHVTKFGVFYITPNTVRFVGDASAINAVLMASGDDHPHIAEMVLSAHRVEDGWEMEERSTWWYSEHEAWYRTLDDEGRPWCYWVRSEFKLFELIDAVIFLDHFEWFELAF